jgi:hypothetical protein
MNHTHAYDMLSLLRKCADTAIKDNDQEPYSRNEYLQNMTNLSKDLTWIQHHVQPYLSQIKITLHNGGK